MAPKRTAGPFLALPSGATARSQRGHLERAYDDFISTGSVATVRPMVADSWRLSRASGVSPDGVLPSVDMLDAELEAYRSGHPLAAVMPLIRRLLIEEAEDAGAIVVVADADARLLWVEGDPTLRRLAEGMNWVAGSRWDERTTGTNAPAAAMRLDHALQVFAREHYASNVAAWSCTAAPIHDPLTGKVLGALDITGRDEVAAPAVLGLVRAAVAAAETELRIRAMFQPATTSRPSPEAQPGRHADQVDHHCPATVVGVGPGPGGADHRVRGRPGQRVVDQALRAALPAGPASRGLHGRSACDRPARAGCPGGHGARRAQPVALPTARPRTIRPAVPDQLRDATPTWRPSARCWPAAMSPVLSRPTRDRSCRVPSRRRCRPSGICCIARSVPPSCVPLTRPPSWPSRTDPPAGTTSSSGGTQSASPIPPPARF